MHKFSSLLVFLRKSQMQSSPCAIKWEQEAQIQQIDFEPKIGFAFINKLIQSFEFEFIHIKFKIKLFLNLVQISIC